MSQLERKLLALMTTAEGMAEVVKSGLRREVFEEPIHRQVFVWMVNYWNKSGKAPTWAVMETEFPAVTLKLREECPVKESVEWLVRELDRRHSWGQLQDIAMKAAVTGCEDPTGALETLARDAKAAMGCPGCGPLPTCGQPSNPGGWPASGSRWQPSACWSATRASARACSGC